MPAAQPAAAQPAAAPPAAAPPVAAPPAPAQLAAQLAAHLPQPDAQPPPARAAPAERLGPRRSLEGASDEPSVRGARRSPVLPFQELQKKCGLFVRPTSVEELFQNRTTRSLFG